MVEKVIVKYEISERKNTQNSPLFFRWEVVLCLAIDLIFIKENSSQTVKKLLSIYCPQRRENKKLKAAAT